MEEIPNMELFQVHPIGESSMVQFNIEAVDSQGREISFAIDAEDEQSAANMVRKNGSFATHITRRPIEAHSYRQKTELTDYCEGLDKESIQVCSLCGKPRPVIVTRCPYCGGHAPADAEEITARVVGIGVLIGLPTIFVVLLLSCIPSASERQEYQQRSSSSSRIDEKTNNRIDPKRLDRAENLEQRLFDKAIQGDNDYSDIERELAPPEAEAHRRIDRLNRRPHQRGYSLKERREAVVKTFIQQGQSREWAEVTVDAMEAQGLLPDPARP